MTSPDPQDLNRIAISLDKIEQAFSPGPEIDSSTLIDQICNIADHLGSIAGSLEVIAEKLK